jgi:hypothetical protein
MMREVVKRLRELDPAVRVSTLRDVLPPIRKSEDLATYVERLRMGRLVVEGASSPFRGLVETTSKQIGKSNRK